MTRTVRRSRFALLLCCSALLLLGAPLPAPAQIPVTDYAHIAVNSYWHYAHYVQFALQLVRQLEQLTALYRQIENQLQALRKLADPNWREVAALLADLDAVMRSGRALGYTLSGIEGEFRQTFPGWQIWSDPAAYQAQTERALDTMRAGLAAANRQAQTLAEGDQTLAAIRAQMAATQGHQQALEQLATLASFTAQEQLLARQSLAVANNLQAVGWAWQLNREAQGQATLAGVMNASSFAAYQDTSPGWTFVPAWWPFP
jgi:P-type conjugative transfer protein TrbJ